MTWFHKKCLEISRQKPRGSRPCSNTCPILLIVQTFGPVAQSSFLQQMGIDTRMEVSVGRLSRRVLSKLACESYIRHGNRAVCAACVACAACAACVACAA